VLEGNFEVVQFRNKGLSYYNQFEYKSEEDFVYFILFAAEQLGLNPETMELVISGNIPGDSGMIRLAEKYIRHVFLMERNKEIPLGPILGQIPEHQHVLLINQDLCGS
jgi:hypothetical protein